MILNEAYVNDSIVARMNFYTNEKNRRGDGTSYSGSDVIRYADILTIYGTQIQVNCSKEEYLATIYSLEKKHICNRSIADLFKDFQMREK